MQQSRFYYADQTHLKAMEENIELPLPCNIQQHPKPYTEHIF